MPSYLRRVLSDKDYYLTMAKRPRLKTASSSFRGVVKTGGNSNKEYRVQFQYKGVRYYIGYYDNELEAAKAYNEAALQIIGDHAILNEIPEQQ